MDLIANYKNGDYTIKMWENGTKEITGEGVPEFPICIDVKITDYCDAGCSYCHEKSTVKGKHGELFLSDDGNHHSHILLGLPKGTELAIGGGNPLSHPDIENFLETLKNCGMISNLTVNSFHLRRYQSMLRMFLAKKLYKGLGISYNPLFKKDILNFKYENAVIHVIAGVQTFSDIEELLLNGKKVLILGYKNFGRGEKYNKRMEGIIEKNMIELYRKLGRLFGKGLLSFDNLAVEQLAPSRFFKKETWDNHYMGDDGEFTMYIDLVKGEYALNSISKTRYKLPKGEHNFWGDSSVNINNMRKIFKKIYNLK